MKVIPSLLLSVLLFILTSCSPQQQPSLSAAEILGNSDYLAFSYGGYRQDSRDIVPTVEELKEDMKILAAMDIKLIRTYNTSQFLQTANLLEAIDELKEEDPSFEMYVMLGAWIECQDAWTSAVNHSAENIANNTAEIEAAVRMAKEYPDIVKMIAVGNEAMAQWAVSYYVQPVVILKWVNYLQDLKSSGELASDIWITSSDNFASWGGGDRSYRNDNLAALVKAVDFVSLHTYPFHDSFYNPAYWGVPEAEENLSDQEKVESAMLRAKEYAIAQYQATADYIARLGVTKPIHIGETGWATIASSSYGATGSQAADEYKQKLYYDHMREWTNNAAMSCFYFEVFDESWKDDGDPEGSENHFGLITKEGQVKYALWPLVDQSIFEGLTRNGQPLAKTYGGDENALLADLLIPPLASEIGILDISTVNTNREAGEKVSEDLYIIRNETLVPSENNNMTYPSEQLKLNAWEGTCAIQLSASGIINLTTGTGGWWGAALEIQSNNSGENLSNFASGFINFDIRGNTSSIFNLGFQTGIYADGTQTNNYAVFGPQETKSITDNWTTHSISIAEIAKNPDLTDVNGLLYLKGVADFDGKSILLRNIYYSKYKMN